MSGHCGRSCIRCDANVLFECQCNNVNCLVYRCRFGDRVWGITKPVEICIYKDYRLCACSGKTKYSFDLELFKEVYDAVEKRVRIVKGNWRLPRFIPVIALYDKRSWFWRDFRYDAIVVRLYEILRNDKLRKDLEGRDLHELLGFDGTIILSSIMPDEILDYFTVEEYIRYIDKLNPDIALALDSYTYYDDPYLLSWEQTLKSIYSAVKLSEIGIPTLPILKGGNIQQIKYSLETFKKLDVDYFVIPIRELLATNKLFLNEIIREVRMHGYSNKYILYGGRITDTYLYKDANSVINLEWYIRSKCGMIFEDGNYRYLSEADNDLLKRLGIVSIKKLMHYNLSKTIALLEHKL